MQSFVAALLLVAASPALAVSDRPEAPVERRATLERVFPETNIEGEGWRGLLPIMLLNADQDARSQSAGGERSRPPAR